jgi:hypothetical protein
MFACLPTHIHNEEIEGKAHLEEDDPSDVASWKAQYSCVLNCRRIPDFVGMALPAELFA